MMNRIKLALFATSLAGVIILSAVQAFAQAVPVCNWGDMIYKASSAYGCLPYDNTPGKFLKGQGASAQPVWSFQADPNFLLPAQSTNTFLGNTSGTGASPVPNTVSQVLDTVGYDISRPPSPGAIIYKSAVAPNNAWQALQPGFSGQVLSSGGAANPPFWSTVGSIGLDSICTTQGSVLYRGASLWSCLAPGTSGQFLTAGGIAANPSWTSNTSAPGGSNGQLQYNSSGTFAGTATGTGILTALGVNVGSAGAPVLLNGALGSPSSIGTLPAFTLNGTIAGGNNQLNDITIGNVSPHPGGFTNLSASGLAEIGTDASLPSGTIFSVSNNTAFSIPAMSGFLPQAVITGADGTRGELALQSYNNSIGGESTILLFGARGTQATPLHSVSGDFTGELFSHPFDGTNFVHNAGSGFIFSTTEDTSPTNSGMKATLYTTPTGTGLNTAQPHTVFDAPGGLITFGYISTKAPVTLIGTSGTVGAIDSSTIFNASGTFTATLPAAASYSGRWLYAKSIAAQTINSASSNVVPLAGGAAGTALLASGAGKWANLQSDGTNWVVMSGN